VGSDLCIRDRTNDIHKIGYLLKKSETKIIEFVVEEEFINLNTKSEYYRALEILKGKEIYT
jgi:molybdopterin-guanine dinucleotide biosynthesis protein A